MNAASLLRVVFLLLLFLNNGFVRAQDQNSEVIVVPPGDKFLRWHGHAGRTYFIQTSDPAAHLESWFWAPVIELGNDEEISYEVGSSAGKGFFRLHYTDDPSPVGVSLEDWDIDADGLTNWQEIATYHTNPLLPDTDGDGLSDGWEVQNALDPLDPSGNNGGGGDPDGDGTNNRDEQDHDTDPGNAADFPPQVWSVTAMVSGSSSAQLQAEKHIRERNWNEATYGEPEDSEGHLTPEDLKSRAEGLPLPGTLAEAMAEPDHIQMGEYEAYAHGHFYASTSYYENKTGNHTVTRVWVRVPPKNEQQTFHFAKLTSRNDPDPSTLLEGEVVTFSVPANQTDSFYIDMKCDSISVLGKDVHTQVRLRAIEPAPAVLAVNSDFDEGRIDPDTGYAIPDCDDVPGVNRDTGAGNDEMVIGTQRAHLDGLYANGEHITDDLHKGWFGVNPHDLEDEFWDGTTVTIRKLDKIDPATGQTESGQVRFYSKWGDTRFGSYYGITPYNLGGFQPKDLVVSGVNKRSGEGVYGSTSTIPEEATFWMEGVRPGKITLQWRLTKESVDLIYEQTFLVETRQSVEDWREEVRYQIRLQTKAKTGSEVDIALYDPANGFRNTLFPSPPENDNVLRVRAIYYYYQQLFQQMPEKFMWAGMAKTAAAPIYAAMSDLTTWWQLQWALPGGDDGAGTKELIEGLLLSGQKAICADKGWAHRAYMASGIGALNWVKDNGNANATDFDAWDDLNTGILYESQPTINQANQDLLEREQFEVVQQYYFDHATNVRMRQSPAWIDWGAAVHVEEDADGLVNVGVWLSANSNKNPMPGGPGFHAVVPDGRIDFVNDRWAWTNNAVNGMLQIWTGDASSSVAPHFDAPTRMAENNKTMYSAASDYSNDTGELPVE